MNGPQILFCFLLLQACQRHPPKVEQEKGRRDRVLALAPSNLDTPVDRQLAAARGRVLADEQSADRWVELGRAWVQKARSSGDSGYHLNAEACANLALAKEPGSRSALNLRGLVLLNAHRFRDAAEVSRQILARDPDDAMALGSLSDALLELGDLEGSERAVERMLDRKPNLPSYARASYLAWLHGDVTGALSLMRLAHDAGRGQRDPEPAAWTLTQLATYFWHRGDLEGAEEGFRRALDALPGYPAARVGRARVTLARGEPAAAAAELEAAYQAQPLVETAWLLADAKEAQGDEDGRARAEGEVLRLGRLSDPRTLAAYLATKHLRPEEALSLAQSEMAERPGPATRDVLALALLRAGKVAEAEHAIAPLLTLGWPDPNVLAHSGWIALAAGRRTEGRRLLSEALALNPHFDRTGAKEARAEVER